MSQNNKPEPDFNRCLCKWDWSDTDIEKRDLCALNEQLGDAELTEEQERKITLFLYRNPSYFYELYKMSLNDLVKNVNELSSLA